MIAALSGCGAPAARTWTFPAPTGDEATVAYPIVFGVADDDDLAPYGGSGDGTIGIGSLDTIRS